MTDIEIARSVKPINIVKVAKKLKLKRNDIVLYGDYKAKICKMPKNSNGKLILVTAINPTKAGNGKTTVSIGLADAFSIKKKKVCLALREPSLGPVFGMKGGATGGGYSQILPMEDINLHFNGDFHAITSANNLLCSLIDNHLFQGNELGIDENKVLFHRCLDLNDRALRDITINGKCYTRQEKFSITAASEIMAIMCLASDLEDLKTRLGDIIVALNKKGEPIYARDLKAEEAMTILLKDALRPNLVQTLRGTPAIVHCGPFANIAHGCNSIIATKMAMGFSDYCITEAGFGADLGAEKFIDVKCRASGLKPDCIVLVATIRALKLHGGHDEKTLDQEDCDSIRAGFGNLKKHISLFKDVFHLPVVVTLNKYATDTYNEVELVKALVDDMAPIVVNDVWGKGGEGALELADEVIKQCETKNDEFTFAYDLDDTIENKMKDIVKKVYGGKNIEISPRAKESLKEIKKLGLSNYPVVMAKTQYSLSDDKSLYGEPKNFTVTIDDLEIRNGAKFIVALCGSMLLMPGLGKVPAAVKMKIDNNEIIEGLF